METIIFWIVLGGVAGWLASLITGSDRSIVGDIIVGILGAVLGGWIFSLIGGRGITGLNLSSFLVAVIGSILLIWILHAIRGDRRATTE